MKRPDFEKLYTICFRRYHELLNSIGDIIDKQKDSQSYTVSDMTRELEQLHDEHTPEDWSH